MSKKKRILREGIVKSQNGLCYLCGVRMYKKPSGDRKSKNKPNKSKIRWATLDHVVALSNGRQFKDNKNLKACCSSCNNLKSDMDILDFFKKYSVSYLRSIHYKTDKNLND